MGERIRGKVTVFVGIGDVADYAQRRLSELRAEIVADPEASQDLDIWVVSPTIRDNWAASRWAELVPDLPDERKVQMSADEFLDQLGRRWVGETLAEIDRLAEEGLSAEAMDGFKAVRKALSAPSAERFLRWCRRAALGQEVGRSVVLCDGLKTALLAFAVLAQGDEVLLREPAAFELGERRVEGLIACQTVPAWQVRERARQRAEQLANQGTIAERATFLVSGSIAGPVDDDPDPELDLRNGETQRDDLVTGASGVRLAFLRADSVLAGTV